MHTIKNIPYSDVGHERQVLDIHLPDEKEFPVFVYFHGGGIESGDKEKHPFIKEMLDEGIAVVCPNYRLYPSAVFPEFLRDAASAVAWTKKHIEEYGSCKKIFVGGSSAGGYLTQMLCFDKKYLAVHGLDSDADITGYVMDAGQPTAHYNVLRERGIDSRRVIVDETAPLFFVEGGRDYAPMQIIVSDNDMENRLEQTRLLYSTLKHFRCKMEKIKLVEVENSGHCEYTWKADDAGHNLFAKMVIPFIKEWAADEKDFGNRK